ARGELRDPLTQPAAGTQAFHQRRGRSAPMAGGRGAAAFAVTSAADPPALDAAMRDPALTAVNAHRRTAKRRAAEAHRRRSAGVVAGLLAPTVCAHGSREPVATDPDRGRVVARLARDPRHPPAAAALTLA